MSSFDNFQHLYVDNQADKTMFLLHGTGGDERDLLPLVTGLEAKYDFVGLRGNVSEHGMNRFFERRSDGSFVAESIEQETQKLAEFLHAWQKKYSLQSADTAFLGYSNGANMILATLFKYPDLISQAVLLHCMLPFAPQKLDLANKSFLVSYGESDQMIPMMQSLQVVETLHKFSATVRVVSHAGGHEIVREEVEELREFLN